MEDHSHWWSFFFVAGDDSRWFYFCQLPCDPDLKVIGTKMAEIIAENTETFGEHGGGACDPKVMPDNILVPDHLAGRLVTRDEVQAFFRTSKGRPS